MRLSGLVTLRTKSLRLVIWFSLPPYLILFFLFLRAYPGEFGEEEGRVHQDLADLAPRQANG